MMFAFFETMFPHSGLQKAPILQMLHQVNEETALVYLGLLSFGSTFFYRLFIEELLKRANLCYNDVWCSLYSCPFPFTEGQIATIRWRIYDNSQTKI